MQLFFDCCNTLTEILGPAVLKVQSAIFNLIYGFIFISQAHKYIIGFRCAGLCSWKRGAGEWKTLQSEIEPLDVAFYSLKSPNITNVAFQSQPVHLVLGVGGKSFSYWQMLPSRDAFCRNT